MRNMRSARKGWGTALYRRPDDFFSAAMFGSCSGAGGPVQGIAELGDRVAGYGGRALQPTRRMFQLLVARQLLGSGPHTRQRLPAALLDDGIAEASADLVLAHLHLQSEQALEHAP